MSLSIMAHSDAISRFSLLGKQLLNKGFSSNSNHQDDGFDKGEALRWAARQGLADLVQELVNADADVESKDEFDNTALHLAALSSMTDGAVKVVKVLTTPEVLGAKPALLEAKNKLGNTVLHLAARNDRVQAMEVLISRNANVSALNNDGFTAIYHAALMGHCNIIRLLLEKPGVEIGHLRNGGYTPLHAACWSGHLDAVKLLVELGSDVNWKDSKNFSPLHRATKQDKPAIV